MSKKRTKNSKKPTEGYRSPLDYAHLSASAQHRLLYVKRKVNNEKEAKLLRKAQQTGHYKLLLIYYFGGVAAFMSCAAFGRFGLIAGFTGLGFVFYRYIRMSWSYDARLTYEREYPVKTITEVHKELVHDGLKVSGYSIAIAMLVMALAVFI